MHTPSSQQRGFPVNSQPHLHIQAGKSPAPPSSADVRPPVSSPFLPEQDPSSTVWSTSSPLRQGCVGTGAPGSVRSRQEFARRAALRASTQESQRCLQGWGRAARGETAAASRAITAGAGRLPEQGPGSQARFSALSGGAKWGADVGDTRGEICEESRRGWGGAGRTRGQTPSRVPASGRQGCQDERGGPQGREAREGPLHPCDPPQPPRGAAAATGRGPGAPRVSRGPRSRGLAAGCLRGAPRGLPRDLGTAAGPARSAAGGAHRHRACPPEPAPDTARALKTQRLRPASRGSFPGPARPSSTQARLSRRRPLEGARGRAPRASGPRPPGGSTSARRPRARRPPRAVVSPGTAPWRGRGVRRRVAEDEQPRAAVSPVTSRG